MARDARFVSILVEFDEPPGDVEPFAQKMFNYFSPDAKAVMVIDGEGSLYAFERIDPDDTPETPTEG